MREERRKSQAAVDCGLDPMEGMMMIHRRIDFSGRVISLAVLFTVDRSVEGTPTTAEPIAIEKQRHRVMEMID